MPIDRRFAGVDGARGRSTLLPHRLHALVWHWDSCLAQKRWAFYPKRSPFSGKCSPFDHKTAYPTTKSASSLRTVHLHVPYYACGRFVEAKWKGQSPLSPLYTRLVERGGCFLKIIFRLCREDSEGWWKNPKSADKLPNVRKKVYIYQLIVHFSRIWTEIGL